MIGAKVEVAVVNGAGVELTGVKGFVLNPSTEKQLGILVKATDKSKMAVFNLFSLPKVRQKCFVKLKFKKKRIQLNLICSDYIKMFFIKHF